jgi:hypothetical protein
MRSFHHKRLVAIVAGCCVLAIAMILVARRTVSIGQNVRPRRTVTTSGSKQSVEIPAGRDLQAAINKARCGDTLVLQAGATWDAPGTYVPFVLPNKGCAEANAITIQSSAHNSLPNGRVSPADAVNMARIRALGGAGAFQFASGSSHWILDGLEITNKGSDTAAEMVNNLVDASDPKVSHITIQRSFLHPKETGKDYTRSVLRAVMFNGSSLTFKWNFASGFYGRLAAGDTGVNTNEVVLCITCNNLTVHDNFLEAWYAAIFTGGGGEEPQYTATLSGTVNTSQADFSSTEGLSAGQYVRLELQGTVEVKSNKNRCGENIQGHTAEDCASLTVTSGTPITANDADHTIWLKQRGSDTTHRGRISSSSGNTTLVFPYNGQVPTGTYSFRVFEAAKVTSISGATVKYEPVGINYLTQSPSVPGQASWRTDQVVHDLTITKNTFNIDYDSAVYEHETYGNSPKGWVEMKAGDRTLFEGNTFTGYVSTMGISQHSDEGSTPWTAVSNLVIKSNFFNPVRDGKGAARAWGQFALTDPYNTDQPGKNVTITNNLILGSRYFFLNEGVDGFIVTHNTVINDQPSKSETATMIFAFKPINFGLVLKDNIMLNNDSGILCTGVGAGAISDCWPSYKMQNNLIIDNFNNGQLASRYGSGILKPIRSNLSQVGFVDISKNDYRLSPSSPFRGKASDGSDPGVDMDVLLAAIGNTASGIENSVQRTSNPPNPAVLEPPKTKPLR